MALTLSIVSRDPAGVVFASAVGSITSRDFPTPEHIYFDTILGKTWASHKVVLDLDAVPFLDSSAIGWLIHTQRLFRESGGLLALHNVQPHVRHILSLLKIDRVVPIGKDAPSASALLNEQCKTPARAAAPAGA